MVWSQMKRHMHIYMCVIQPSKHHSLAVMLFMNCLYCSNYEHFMYFITWQYWIMSFTVNSRPILCMVWTCFWCLMTSPRQTQPQHLFDYWYRVQQTVLVCQLHNPTTILIIRDHMHVDINICNYLLSINSIWLHILYLIRYILYLTLCIVCKLRAF